jgi:uncharacterized protein YjbI with pentapeptide repeats
MKTINAEELKEIIRRHALWLDDKDGGVKADLSDCDLRGSDLSDCDLSDCDLSGSDLRGSNLRGSNLRGSDLSDCDLDFSALSFSCKSLSAKFDQKHIIQILYHAAKPTQQNTLDLGLDIKELFNSDIFKKVVNKFHRVEECGEFTGVKEIE